jgi:voltage-gated potassium channel Kch
MLSKLIRTMLAISAFALGVHGQGLSPTTPAVLYVYFGGETVAAEFWTGGTTSSFLSTGKPAASNYLIDSPFEEDRTKERRFSPQLKPAQSDGKLVLDSVRSLISAPRSGR